MFCSWKWVWLTVEGVIVIHELLTRLIITTNSMHKSSNNPEKYEVFVTVTYRANWYHIYCQRVLMMRRRRRSKCSKHNNSGTKLTIGKTSFWIDNTTHSQSFDKEMHLQRCWGFHSIFSCEVQIRCVFG